MDYFEVLGVKIGGTNLFLTCDVIKKWVMDKVKTYICIAPVATIMDCQKDPKYREIINGSGITTPDGMPVVWLGKMKGMKKIARTYGPDLMLELCKNGQQEGLTHYFYGGLEEVNQKLIHRLKSQFENIKIGGSFAPSFRNIGELEDDQVIKKINNANADVLWVGLGSPKQDYWMYNHREKLNVPVMIGVGAAFDFLSGSKKQAPRWMQVSGLEWLFRLCQEPRRLWKRYLVGNTIFVYLILKEAIFNFGKKSEKDKFRR